METIALDTGLFLDLLSGEQRLEEKAKLRLQRIRKGAAHGVMSVTLLSELYYHIAKQWGAEKADERIMVVAAYPNVSIEPVTNEIALLAGKLRFKYYHRVHRDLSYIDCIHLATAITSNCTKFVTGDKDFKGVEEILIEVY